MLKCSKFVRRQVSGCTGSGYKEEEDRGQFRGEDSLPVGGIWHIRKFIL